MTPLPRSHTAVVLTAPGQPLAEQVRPTSVPEGDDVLVRVSHVGIGHLDVWRADHGLLLEQYPHVLGANIAGTVAAVGLDASDRFKEGERVFGFGQGAYQQYVTYPAWRLAKVPENLSLVDAATVPDNLVTAVWSLSEGGLGLPLFEEPGDRDIPVVIWGGGGSVGQYSVQILKLSGYTNIITTASSRHFSRLQSLGARVVVDYTQPDWEAQLLSACTGTAKGEGEGKRRYTHVLDAIGDVDATVTPISKVLDHQRSVVAAMLPLFKKQKDQETSEVYMENPVPLPEGARFVGVRTHFYHHNEHYKRTLQPETMPALLQSGKITPDRAQLVEGASLVARFQNALDTLRKGVSGQRLVVKVE